VFVIKWRGKEQRIFAKNVDMFTTQLKSTEKAKNYLDKFDALALAIH